MTFNFRWLSLNRLVWLFIVLLTAAAFQKFLIGQYNNYLMFARPFACLLQHQSMYVHHPELYDDLYKYSPVFAWLMAPLYYLPNWLGVLVWNLLNAAGLVIGRVGNWPGWQLAGSAITRSIDVHARLNRDPIA